jgi:hypothetical protein
MDRQELFIMMEPDIKGNTKTVNGMVREFIIGQMEIRRKGTTRMVKSMRMLYYTRRMEQSIN